jgi:hypothetical protein
MSKSSNAELPLAIIDNPVREYSFAYNNTDKNNSPNEAEQRYSEHLIDFSVPFVFTIYFKDDFNKIPLFPAINIFFLKNEVKFVYSSDLNDDLRKSCVGYYESEIKHLLENYNVITVPSSKAEHHKLLVSVNSDYFAYAFADYLHYSSCYNKSTIIFGSIK